MAEKIVINSGPLIALVRMNALDILDQLPFEFYTPKEVVNELNAGPPDFLSQGLPSSLSVVSLKNSRLDQLFRNLDSGEAAVIQLAIEMQVEKVCIDELKGRKIALQQGLKPLGSLGLLGRARSLAIIDEIKPFIVKAISAGVYYDEVLVADFLPNFNEKW